MHFTQEIIEGLTQGVAVYRPTPDGQDFLLTYLNPAAARLVRRDRAELIGQTLGEAFPGAAAMGLLELLRQVHATGEPGLLEASRYQDDHLDRWAANRVFRLASGELATVFEDQSSRVAADRAQVSIRNRYRSVFENSLIGIFTVNRERVIEEINQRACEIFGLNVAEAVGSSVALFHCSPEHYRRFGVQFFAQVDQGGVFNIRYPLRRADGSVFPAALSGKPRNGRDLTDGVVWVVADLSEAQAVEAALRESEERYALAVAGANDGLWDWKVPEDQVYYSPRWKAMLGYDDAELPNRFEEWRTRVHPDDLAGALAAIDAHLQGAVDHLDIEFRMRHKDGTWRWILARAACVRDAEGRPLRMAGSHTDITERKRVADQLQENERRLHAVFTAVQTGIAIIDLEARRVVDANDKASEILRIDRQALVGTRCYEHFCADPRVCPFLSDLHQRGQDEISLRGPDGRAITVLKSVVALNLSGRRLLVESFVDITERKLAEQDLRAAKEQAEQAALVKSEFMAKMSHEIRTPMNSIIGMTKLTLDSELDTEQRENLEIVEASAEALLSLIDDVLDFSKIEAGQVELEAVDFELAGVVEDVMDSFGYRAAQKGIELVHLIEPTVPTSLSGDPSGLRQILVNLIGNALKFTETGEVLLEVVAETQDVRGLLLRFTITDTGVGVPVDKRAAIFEAFIQADNTTRRRYEGTGLGLTISRQLVRMMGGEIGLEGRPEGGSRFWFTARFGLAESPAPSTEGAVAVLAGAHCLIVDDNRANRLVLEKTLSTWSCRVAAVTGGREAVAELARAAAAGTPYDLVLLDMMMPDLDGEETARLIQADPANGQPRVIVLTSVGHRGEAQRLAGQGVVGCLLKPIRRAQLFETLTQAMQRTPGVGTPGGREPPPAVPARAARDTSLAGLHVLLAEDKPFNQRLAVQLLARRGVLVTTADDGRQALAIAASVPFDLILMDVQMPVMDGFDATRAIREQETAAAVGQSGRPRRRTPIIAMTAHALKGDRERCLAAGMDDYLTKPIDAERLCEKVRLWSGRADGVPSPVSAGIAPRPAGTAGAPIHPDSAVALARIAAASGDDPSGLAGLVALFIEDAERDLDALQTAVMAGDASAVVRLAHSLKGMIRNVGLSELGELFSRIEGLGGDADGAAAVAQAARCIHDLLAGLRAYLAEVPP